MVRLIGYEKPPPKCKIDTIFKAPCWKEIHLQKNMKKTPSSATNVNRSQDQDDFGPKNSDIIDRPWSLRCIRPRDNGNHQGSHQKRPRQAILLGPQKVKNWRAQVTMTPNEDFSSILMELPMELPMHQKKTLPFWSFPGRFRISGRD